MASVRFALVGVCYISEEHAIITTNTNKHSTKKHTSTTKNEPPNNKQNQLIYIIKRREWQLPADTNNSDIHTRVNITIYSQLKHSQI